jgi:hypothetical protein
MEQPVKRKSGGERGDPDSEVNVTGHFDHFNAQHVTSIGGTHKSTYPAPSSKATLKISTDDVVFALKSNKDKFKTIVSAKLNGLGIEAAAQFPDPSDADMRTKFLKNQIKIIGRSTTDHPATLVDDIQGFSIQTETSGKRHGVAAEDFAPGQYVEAVLPHPSKIYDRDQIVKPGDEPDSVTLELRPYNPRRFANEIFSHLDSQLNNRKKYINGMNATYRSTDEWLNVGQSFFELLTFSGLLFKYFDLTFFDTDNTAQPTRMNDFIKDCTRHQLIAPDSRYPIDPNEYDIATEFRRQFLQMVICSGQIQNSFFGNVFARGATKTYNGADFTVFESIEESTPGIVNGKIIKDSAEGQIIDKQLNLVRRFCTSVAAASRQDASFILGMATGPAQKGRIFPRV